MKYVRSLTEGTVVTKNHVIHANKATPLAIVPQEIVRLARLTPPKVEILDQDPFAAPAKGSEAEAGETKQ